jgi:hypothetical protein
VAAIDRSSCKSAALMLAQAEHWPERLAAALTFKMGTGALA